MQLTFYLARVAKGSKGTIWEVKEHFLATPKTSFQMEYLYTAVWATNEEKKLNVWPTTSSGSGSNAFSFGLSTNGDIGADGPTIGGTVSGGYTYSRDFTDITIVSGVLAGNVNGTNPNSNCFQFNYKYNSIVAKNQSGLDVGFRYQNSKKEFEVELDFVVSMRRRTLLFFNDYCGFMVHGMGLWMYDIL